MLVSVGHSDATAAQVAAAADAGARMVTHLYDAQRPLHHREPGVVGQALADPRLTSGLIADLHHVSAVACADRVRRRARPDLPGHRRRRVRGHAAGPVPARRRADRAAARRRASRRVRADGTLAGSALRMDQAVANMVRPGSAWPTLVAAATRIPADLIGRPDLGRIAPGAAADLAWLGDDLQASATWIGGRLVFEG